MNYEILEPDASLQRRALIMLVGATVLFAFLIMTWPVVERSLLLARYEGRIAARTICGAFLAIMVVISIGVVIGGVRMLAFGRNILRTGQHPPPGTRVFFRTRVVRGGLARFSGLALAFGGVGVVLCGVMLLALCWQGVLILT